MKLKRIIATTALALTFSTALTHVAQAAPLVGLIFGPIFAATIGGQILGVVFGAVASYAFSFVANKLFPPSSTQDSTTTSAAEIKYGERVARAAIFGTVLVGGHLVHMNEYSSSKQLQYVAVIGDCWHSGIAGVQIDQTFKEVTEVALSANNEHKRYTVEDFEDVIDLRFHDGRPGQAADTGLVTQTSGWTSDKKFSNMAYFVADLKSDKEKFSGIPQIQPIGIGVRCYDPRKDSSFGGSGTHRFNDPTTWEYSANPAVQAYHFLRGFFFNGIRVLGVGYAAAELSTAHWAAAMNVCDEDVVDPELNHRPRYACHLFVEDTTQFSQVLDQFCDAMGGYYTEIAGQLAVFAGKAQSSVLTITDGDLVADEDLYFNPGRPGETLATGIQGTYIHSADYTPTPYTSIEPPEFDSAQWYPQIIPVDFNQVQNAHQAFLLAKQKLYANRMQATANVVLPFTNIALQVNDWITWASDMTMIGTRVFKIVQISYNLVKRRLYLTLAETSADVYDDDATPDDVQEPIRTPQIPIYITTVNSLALTPILLEGPSGEQIPAIDFTYTPILDPGVLAVDISYRTAADGPTPAGPIFKVTDFTPADGVVRATNGITPGMVHEAFARLIAAPGREVVDTAWVSALFPTGNLATVVVVGDGTITLIKLASDLQNVVGLLTSDGEGSVFSLIANLNAEIERQANAAYTMNTNYDRRTQILSRQTGQVAAAVIQEQSVRITADAALAQAITEVVAQVNDNLADGYLKLEALVDGGGSMATIAAKVRASFADTYSEAGWILRATADGDGNSVAAFGVLGTFYVFEEVDGNAIPIFSAAPDGAYFTRFYSFAQTNAGTPKVIIDGVSGAFSITVDT